MLLWSDLADTIVFFLIVVWFSKHFENSTIKRFLISEPWHTFSILRGYQQNLLEESLHWTEMQQQLPIRTKLIRKKSKVRFYKLKWYFKHKQKLSKSIALEMYCFDSTQKVSVSVFPRRQTTFTYLLRWLYGGKFPASEKDNVWTTLVQHRRKYIAQINKRNFIFLLITIFLIIFLWHY